jgi:hypothetical protein
LQHRQAAQLLEDAYSADQEARQAAAASDYAAKQAIRQLTARVAQLEQVEDELCNCRTRLAAAEKAAARAASQAEVVSTNFVGACSCPRCFVCASRLSLAKLTLCVGNCFLMEAVSHDEGHDGHLTGCAGTHTTTAASPSSKRSRSCDSRQERSPS